MTTAYQDKIPYLYHWQRFDARRFEYQLRNETVYCSSPRDFNDPWDCRPFFNTDLLADPAEHRKHIDYVVDMCKRDGRMSTTDIERMRRALADREVCAKYVLEHTNATQQAVLDRYRVYCLCPDVNNLLMWAHYADNHRGICLEFNVANETVCSAQAVRYFREFPMVRQYSNSEAENLLPLLAKGDAWKYEREYRLIAQNANNRTADETLITQDGHLKLAKGALRSVIVGHLGPFEQIKRLLAQHAPHVAILQANIVPNRYELKIAP